MIGIDVFIGSSLEGLPIAQQVQYELHHLTAPRLWTQGVFEPGGSTLRSLLKEVRSHDFAVLVLSPDDTTTSREATSTSPRDNVIFELGLFMGRLGPNRTFLLYDKSSNLKIMSDFDGITKVPYDGQWAQADLPAAIGTACTPITQAIRRLGPFRGRDHGFRKDSEIADDW